MNNYRDNCSCIEEVFDSSHNKNILKSTWLDTKLGPMIAIADEKMLYLLEFAKQKGLEYGLESLKHKTKSVIISGRTASIDSIEKELEQYFDERLTEFKTPIMLLGSPFQQSVWKELQKIPHGETRSYFDIASSLGKPSAFRAVAQANGANRLAIIVPCHRVINKNGDLGGYAGGLSHKKWLLYHENKENSYIVD